MAKVIKKVKKVASSAVKGARRVGSDIGREIEGVGRAYDRDFIRPLSDAADSAIRAGGGIVESLWGLKPPKLKIPGVAGVSQFASEPASPNVDLSRTEGKRRDDGDSKGTRKLRVPLGGLR